MVAWAEENLVEFHTVLTHLDTERVRATGSKPDCSRLREPISSIDPAPTLIAATSAVGRQIHEKSRCAIERVRRRSVDQRVRELNPKRIVLFCVIQRLDSEPQCIRHICVCIERHV